MGGFYKKTIKDIDVTDKRVLLRADYNVPLDEHGQVADDYRIRMSLPTLRYLLDRNCKIVAMSHLGRPEGYDPQFSLAPVAKRLQELLPDVDVTLIDGIVGDTVKKELAKRRRGSITLLENVRFDEREEQEDDAYAQELSQYADIFVQDAFGVVHRNHVTLTGIPKYLKSYAGLLVEKEYVTITDAIDSPDRPMIAVVGGAKISDKIKVLKKFVETADIVTVVGAMANTFLLAKGYKIGASLAEPEQVGLAKEVLNLAEQRSSEGFQFFLPTDFIVSTSMNGDKPTRIVELGIDFISDVESYPKKPPIASYEVSDDEMILDIGPSSAHYVAGLISLSKTAVWSGTAGVAEVSGYAGAAAPFAHTSHVIAAALSGNYFSSRMPFAVAGGGDTVAFIESTPGLRENMGHVSTGGSASLELMSGNLLPGIEALENKE